MRTGRTLGKGLFEGIRRPVHVREQIRGVPCARPGPDRFSGSSGASREGQGRGGKQPERILVRPVDESHISTGSGTIGFHV